MAIIQLINDNFDDDNNKTAVPFLLHVLTCTTFPQGYLLNVRGLSLAIHSRRDSSRLKKKNVTQLQLDIFSAFYVLFYLWLLKALSRQFCNLCAHKLNGCHLNIQHYWGLEPFQAVVVQLRRCRTGFGLKTFGISVALKTRPVKNNWVRSPDK